MSVAAEIAGRLADGGVVIIDGGTGTQVQAEGAAMDVEAWSGPREPGAARRGAACARGLHPAGAEVIIANTFAASRAALEPAGLGSRVADANRNAVAAALRAREAAAGGRAVAIAGSMSAFCPAAVHGGNEPAWPPRIGSRAWPTSVSRPGCWRRRGLT